MTKGSCFVVDVIANIRKVRRDKLKLFGDFVSLFANISTQFQSDRITEFLFDLYTKDGSKKDSERRRRATTVSDEVTTIAASNPLPKEMTAFWPSKGCYSSR